MLHSATMQRLNPDEQITDLVGNRGQRGLEDLLNCKLTPS